MEAVHSGIGAEGLEAPASRRGREYSLEVVEVITSGTRARTGCGAADPCMIANDDGPRVEQPSVRHHLRDAKLHDRVGEWREGNCRPARAKKTRGGEPGSVRSIPSGFVLLLRFGGISEQLGAHHSTRLVSGAAGNVRREAEEHLLVLAPPGHVHAEGCAQTSWGCHSKRSYVLSDANSGRRPTDGRTRHSEHEHGWRCPRRGRSQPHWGRHVIRHAALHLYWI